MIALKSLDLTDSCKTVIPGARREASAALNHPDFGNGLNLKRRFVVHPSSVETRPQRTTNPEDAPPPGFTLQATRRPTTRRETFYFLQR
ncbi:hypothetical protein EYF80_045635 [Liparis tanakae]|uniref:Uncharacterized protein n=1 Tax=Liparis tanakae TaxID=230148 RepID=A0A4Z2FTH2_9TELE|nr:hypothetical protein EYF80_045635 [Liparis tanakae]